MIEVEFLNSDMYIKYLDKNSVRIKFISSFQKFLFFIMTHFINLARMLKYNKNIT